MAKTLTELRKLIHQARADVRQRGRAVEKAQDRVDKFAHKYQAAKGKRNHHASKLRAAREAKQWVKAQRQKAARDFFQRRMARNKQKVRYWTKREGEAISATRGAKKRLGKWVTAMERLSPANAKKVMDKARSYLGTQEGGAQQRAWSARLGYSSYLPWCSIFVANMLIEAGVCTKEQLPSSPAYSGAWINWGRAHRVAESDAAPGDIVVFDWGDGGMTDHVALYEGGGRHIGGNQSNAVTRTGTPWGNVVAVMRLET